MTRERLFAPPRMTFLNRRLRRLAIQSSPQVRFEEGHGGGPHAPGVVALGPVREAVGRAFQADEGDLAAGRAQARGKPLGLVNEREIEVEQVPFAVAAVGKVGNQALSSYGTNGPKVITYSAPAWTAQFALPPCGSVA